MRGVTLHLVAAALLLLAPVQSLAAEVKVIGHPDLPVRSLTAEQLKRIFLLTTTAIEGVSVEPVIAPKTQIHEDFLRQYVGKTEAALNTYYWSLVFTGRAFMPRSFETEAEVVAYVAKTRGAIGYVSAGAAIHGVRVLPVTESGRRAGERSAR